ncbi:MAG: class I SAM-dependent methyltransferase [Myxococcota bacterium]
MSDQPTRRGGFDMRSLAGERFPPPEWHLEKIEEEMTCPDPKVRMMSVIKRMGNQVVPDFSGVDWDAELAAFGEIDYPTYYRQPFHSVPGGYLSEAAAVGDRGAMEAIYEEAHPRRSLGVRDELATLVPETAGVVVDLGGGTGDLGAAIARRLPDAQVRSIDASPFMVIAGRVQNAGLANLDLVQGFAERTGLADASVDAVMITLVFHECPDAIKRTILDEVMRILRPGGTLALSDTPHDDLHDFRGFYEPYKEQWLVWDEQAALAEAGFVDVTPRDVAPPLFSVVCRKPG